MQITQLISLLFFRLFVNISVYERYGWILNRKNGQFVIKIVDLDLLVIHFSLINNSTFFRSPGVSTACV